MWEITLIIWPIGCSNASEEKLWLLFHILFCLPCLLSDVRSRCCRLLTAFMRCVHHKPEKLGPSMKPAWDWQLMQGKQDSSTLASTLANSRHLVFFFCNQQLFNYKMLFNYNYTFIFHLNLLTYAHNHLCMHATVHMQTWRRLLTLTDTLHLGTFLRQKHADLFLLWVKRERTLGRAREAEWKK